MRMTREQWKFLQDKAKLIEFAASKGYVLTDGEAYRPAVTAWVNALPPESNLQAIRFGVQEIITYPGTVGGLGIAKSLHTQRLAQDFNIIKPDGTLAQSVEDYRELGEYWESLDPQNVWGGRWEKPDSDHFQRTPKV